MLRHTGRLLLSECLVSQAAAASTHCCQWTQQIQLRLNSSNTIGNSSAFVHNSVDEPVTGALSQADALVSASQAAGEAAVLAAQGSTWWGTRKAIDILMWTHDSIGLPWFEAIAVSNLILKLGLLPLTVIMQAKQPAMQAMRADTEKLQAMAKQALKAKTPQENERLRLQVRADRAVFDDKYKSTKKLAFLIPVSAVTQMALFISQFSAVSTLANEKLPSMANEGAWWFKDLTMPDPVYGLPIICCVATLAMLQSNAANAAMGQMPGSNPQISKRIMSIAALLIIPFGGWTSAAVGVLWASNAIIQVAQNLLLANSTFRSTFGLPPLAAAPATQPTGTSWLEQFGVGNSSTTQQKPPPPGMQPGFAVNYLANKPRRKRYE
eukprot:GHRR01002400.1.p1 GENE.GHRR01002400.1~~GHRR01002400.1.p1  ORF type:complete len:380 (+),score=123.10 GHRR01002400.1:157-1296(+)